MRTKGTLTNTVLFGNVEGKYHEKSQNRRCRAYALQHGKGMDETDADCEMWREPYARRKMFIRTVSP